MICVCPNEFKALLRGQDHKPLNKSRHQHLNCEDARAKESAEAFAKGRVPLWERNQLSLVSFEVYILRRPLLSYLPLT